MIEIWKDIEGFEGIYKISDHARVKSLARYVKNGFRGYEWTEDKIMKQSEDQDGYLLIGLSKNEERKTFKVHRLVAIHFIPNPNNYPCINHKDGKKKNNYPVNLEWCTVAYNNKHMYEVGLKKNNTYVAKYSLDNELIDVYFSIKEAARLNNLPNGNVSRVVNKHLKTLAKHKWSKIDKATYEKYKKKEI